MKALVLAMLVALPLATPASAFTPAGQALVSAMVPQPEREIVQGREIAAASLAPARRSSEAAERYFAADFAVTLGALVLACGVFAVAGYANKRRAAPAPKPAWEDAVMQALEAELAQFAYEYRRAA